MIFSQKNNNEILQNERRKKMRLIQKDRFNFQKIHQIARIVNPDDRVTRHTIPWIIKWLKTIESMEKMK
jgi:hypothetical protein